MKEWSFDVMSVQCVALQDNKATINSNVCLDQTGKPGGGAVVQLSQTCLMFEATFVGVLTC